MRIAWEHGEVYDNIVRPLSKRSQSQGTSPHPMGLQTRKWRCRPSGPSRTLLRTVFVHLHYTDTTPSHYRIWILSDRRKYYILCCWHNIPLARPSVLEVDVFDKRWQKTRSGSKVFSNSVEDISRSSQKWVKKDATKKIVRTCVHIWYIVHVCRNSSKEVYIKTWGKLRTNLFASLVFQVRSSEWPHRYGNRTWWLKWLNVGRRWPDGERNATGTGQMALIISLSGQQLSR